MNDEIENRLYQILVSTLYIVIDFYKGKSFICAKWVRSKMLDAFGLAFIQFGAKIWPNELMPWRVDSIKSLWWKWFLEEKKWTFCAYFTSGIRTQ